MEVGIFLRVRRRRRINLQTVLTPNPGEGRDRKSKNQGARQQRAYIDISAEPYLRNVHRAGGWKRYEQAHIARLAPMFAKIFPRPRLPQELVAQVLRFCFHTGFY